MPSQNYTVQELPLPTQSAQDDGLGPLAAVAPSNDPYSLQQLRYPLSGIGTTEVPSYVVFYINLPTSSKYIASGGLTVANANIASVQNFDTIQQAGGNYNPVNSRTNIVGAETLAGITSAVNSGLEAGAKTVITGAPTAGLIRTLDLRPKLTRIAKSIAIYMPDTVAATYSHEWDGVSATSAGGNIAKYAQLGGSFKGGLQNLADAAGTVMKNVLTSGGAKFNSAQSAELASGFAEDNGVVGQGFTDLTLRAQGRAVNPHVEMTFKATQNRQFQFDFHFLPRSQQESVAIYNIIQTFKAFAAAEVSSEAGGRYFIPPGQFDIQFYFMQAENPTIAKISTCALETIQVNYSGGGQWATFNDGNPLQIDLQLAFKEVDIITRELISKYGY